MRWRVDHHTHTAGGLFELETTETWTVVALEPAGERVVRIITQGSAASYDGVGWSGGWSGGVRSVAIEGEVLVITGWGGEVRREPVEAPQATP